MNQPHSPERFKPGKTDTVVTIVVAVIAFLGLGFVLLPSTGGHPRGVMDRMQSQNNMKMIGLALHNYHDTYGEFPPAYVTDSQGKPLYSWRVLILPFIEAGDLYDQFDLDAAWDSPTNKPLISQMPEALTSPFFFKTRSQGKTPYLAVVDSQRGRTVLRPGPGRKFNYQLKTDAIDQSVMVIDDPGRMVIWTKPDDISPQQLLSLDPIDQNELHGIHVLYGDAKVEHFDEEACARLGNLIFCDEGRIPNAAR